jgi:glycosyltransferase involved in cell wall biosynthesis
MRVSVIIPVYNAEKTIVSCLESLHIQSCTPDEVIVIDNCSNDKTVYLVKCFIEHEGVSNIILCSENKKGQAAARNRGINLSNGDIIAFIDSDCIARKDWVEQIKNTFIKDPNLDIVGGKFFSYQPNSLVSKFLSMFWAPDMSKVKEIQVAKKTDFFLDKYVHIFNAAFKKDVLLKLKGFDEEMFPSGEDMDIWMRALEIDAKIIAWNPNIIIHHIHRDTIKGLTKQAFIYGESLAHFSKKHFCNKIILPLLPLNKILTIKSTFTIIICPSFIRILTICLIFLLSLIFPVKIKVIIFLLLFSYFYYMIIVRIKNTKIKVSFVEVAGILFLFLIRELVEETGRIYGLLKYKVVCI